MLQKRQNAIFDPGLRSSAQITSLAQEYPAGHVILLHFHNRDQLVFASRGVMTVRVSDSTWVAPTNRAVWIPATVPHTILMSGEVSMRTLYLRPQLAKAMPRSCCVVNVSPLLRELILHACTLPVLNKGASRQRHLIDLIVDQLDTIQTLPLQLPDPSDPRALRIANALLSNPRDRRTLTQLCKIAGAGKRTIEREFQKETGMSFGKWRQQLRLMQALRLLAGGAKVTHAALDAGYSTPSAFISMFRKILGTTPARYFDAGTLAISEAKGATGWR